VPSYFAVRKSQSQRKERIAFDWTADSPSATNGLGVDIKTLRVRSPQGKLFIVHDFKAGQKVPLTDHPESETSQLLPISAMQNLRSNYFNTVLTGSFRTSDELPAGSYLAEIDAWNPFVEEGIDRTTPYQNKTAVFGIFE
jgi:hypothetical protein